jgi:hypothetical protein
VLPADEARSHLESPQAVVGVDSEPRGLYASGTDFVVDDSFGSGLW